MEALKLYDELVPRYRALFRGRLGEPSQLSAVDIDCNMSSDFLSLSTRRRRRAGKRWLDTQDVAVLPGSASEARAGHLRSRYNIRRI